ncbi:MAG: ABC transporter ATP-binding protein [Anaerolineae bacterium]
MTTTASARSTAPATEFAVEGAYPYDHRSPGRWVLSHLWRDRWITLVTLLMTLGSYVAFSLAQLFVGDAANLLLSPNATMQALATISVVILGAFILSGILDLGRSLSIEILAQRFERNARTELYISLLGKSQTFHDRQRVGNLMAMATDDTQQLNMMVNPGFLFISDIVLGFTVPLLTIATIHAQLLIIPLIFVAAYIFSVRRYARRLNPITERERDRFARMNAVAEESVSGIETVKATSQEGFERRRFSRRAYIFRNYFVRQGYIEATYIPVLLYGLALGASFVYGFALVTNGTINIGQLISFMALFGLLRFPTFIGIFCFTLVQLGLAGSKRILGVINAVTDLDQNTGGYSAPMKGEIVFEDVSFGFEDGGTALEHITMRVAAGQTVALVGATGSGKSTLAELINRTYDATSGRVLVDGVDVRDWNLTSLRSQISKIEQDVFLFSRSIADNIAFGAPNATEAEIEEAAREAQADAFIAQMPEGYQTVVGERGTTLSGGQRQRVALARAFLSDPRILILDDSTSAIDSATEDEIQKAIRRAQEGRTTLLITHRLSQIRWADVIVMLEAGHVVAVGSHDELLRRSPHYRRIFARYDVDLPPLEAQPATP